MRTPPRSLSGIPEGAAAPKIAHDLKKSALRSGTLTFGAQGCRFVIKLGSTMVLARLLAPGDFGAVAMVTALTGFLQIIRGGALSNATVQREEIRHEQVSNLFWINVLIGAGLTLFCLGISPWIATFYGDERLTAITVALSPTFLIGAMAIQHQALLRREMRFQAISVIGILANVLSVSVGIAGAAAGWGYWALVAIPITSVLVDVTGVWIALDWVPGRPRRGCGTGSLVMFGGTMTASSVMGYFSRNADNILIGWRWGAGPLGLYTKAYSILLIPITQVTSPFLNVAISTLSRMQNEPDRFRRYFLGAYEVAASLMVPVILTMVVFVDEVILVMLGPGWEASAPIFLLLAPAALVTALSNPLGWVLVGTGKVSRDFKLHCIWSPAIVAAFWIGLEHGPEGVAISYSAACCVLVLPVLYVGLRGTPVHLLEMMGAASRPLVAATLACALGYLFKITTPESWPALVVVAGGFCLVFSVYALILLVVMKRWNFYVPLVRHMLRREDSKPA